MCKVFIGVGHGGGDSGAVKYLVEKDVNLKMALACRDYLEQNGVKVVMSRESDVSEALTDKINRCNAFDPDVALDIHNNAGGGEGFEVFHSVVLGIGKELAKNIEGEVLGIGQKSRGCKIRKNSSGRDYFGFIRLTKCPAVICEGAFVDNRVDAAKIDTDAECQAFGIAYAKGILKTLGRTVVEGSDFEKKGYLVKVTTDALRIRDGAGTEYKINGMIRDRGVYTIVDENDGWGKLKSGAGWIYLHYTKKL